ncbi:hypothetical protein ACEYYA_11020 [Paracoccus sp. p3-h83]|uniref:hypothetical protein n=1 Tax=Paracoccus sp. p3-h83 TaxID=3342805 RepID=UPI0035B97771
MNTLKASLLALAASFSHLPHDRVEAMPVLEFADWCTDPGAEMTTRYAYCIGIIQGHANVMTMNCGMQGEVDDFLKMDPGHGTSPDQLAEQVKKHIIRNPDAYLDKGSDFAVMAALSFLYPCKVPAAD